MTSTKIKGIVLAGGQGTRLNPITKVINKHLLPIYNLPMIYYPVKTLVKAGIKDIMIVSSEDHLESFKNLFKDQEDFNCNFEFGAQKGFGGIADAVNVAAEFCSNSKSAVILGDNIYEDDFSKEVEEFSAERKGAHIFLKECTDAHRFGVAEIEGDRNVINIEEKPEKVKTNFAVTGLYLYDEKVFDIIKKVSPSERGELEITDVNNWYIQNCQMKAEFVKGEWIDAGTFESLYNASRLARKISKNSNGEL